MINLEELKALRAEAEKQMKTAEVSYHRLSSQVDLLGHLIRMHEEETGATPEQIAVNGNGAATEEEVRQSEPA